MNNGPHGIVIKVENLDISRTFYRDVLGLGAPVMDSSIWVEFRLNENVSLVLEKTDDGERLSVKKGRVSWMYNVPDLKIIMEKLEEEGHEPLEGEIERVGYKIVKYCDPEGNPFYIYS